MTLILQHLRRYGEVSIFLFRFCPMRGSSSRTRVVLPAPLQTPMMQRVEFKALTFYLSFPAKRNRHRS